MGASTLVIMGSVNCLSLAQRYVILNGYTAGVIHASNESKAKAKARSCST